jgi:hypothetical protein
MATKAIGLISGGLDSALAVRVLQEQGIEAIGLHCRHPFHPASPAGTESHALSVARELGIEAVEPDVSEAMIALVRDPPHGRGRFLNPCVDCRILYLREGERLRAERGAVFVFTGEVLGQRPMSQRRDAMDVIDRDAGLKGRVLRPLSARRLKPTAMEESGLVDRERLLDLSGRARRPQLELAAKYGIKSFSAPAGGCLLTFEDFARKLDDLIRHDQLGRHELELLKIGRHFRLSPAVFLAMGKSDGENEQLGALAAADDLVLTTLISGPLAVVRGPATEAEIELAVALMGRYMKGVEAGVTVVLSHGQGGPEREVRAMPLSVVAAERYRI